MCRVVEHMDFMIHLLKEVLFSAGGKQWKEKWKWWEFRAQPPFTGWGWKVGPRMGGWRFDYCISLLFFLFYSSQQFSVLFLVLEYAGKCVLSRWLPWGSEGLRLTPELRPLAERSNSSTEGMPLWEFHFLQQAARGKSHICFLSQSGHVQLFWHCHEELSHDSCLRFTSVRAGGLSRCFQQMYVTSDLRWLH